MEQKNSCEGLISPEECSKLLDSFQSNKSPGNDGIPAEFYRKNIRKNLLVKTRLLAAILFVKSQVVPDSAGSADQNLICSLFLDV